MNAIRERIRYLENDLALVERDVPESETDPAAFIANISAACEGLDRARVELSGYLEYGDPSASFMVTGWRPATAAEIAAFEARDRAIVAAKEAEERATYERLRAKFEEGEAS